MKLDDLLTHETLRADPNEWRALLVTINGITAGREPLTLTRCELTASGALFLRFEFTAPRDIVGIGTFVVRAWQQGGRFQQKVIRDHSWDQPMTFQKGDALDLEVLVWPEDLA